MKRPADSPVFYFVIPSPSDFPSGGNRYNALLTSALKERRVNVQIIDFQSFEEHISRHSNGVYLLDSLFLKQFSEISFERNPRIRVYLLLHFLPSMFPPNTRVFERTERPILEKMEGFLVSSLFSKKYLLNKGFPPHKIGVIPPAFRCEVPLEKRDHKNFKALVVSNLIENKGVLPFLRQLGESGRMPSESGFRLTLIGSEKMEPDYAKACLKIIHSNPSLRKRVNLKGSLPHREILEWYRQSNLFISTSPFETFGMALQEAVAFRLPILALQGGNASFHIEEGANGYLFTDAKALVLFLKKLATQKGLFEKLGNAAWRREISEDYRWERAAELFLKYFNAGGR